MWALEVAVRLFMGTLHLGDRIPGFPKAPDRSWKMLSRRRHCGDRVALQGLLGLASGTIGKWPQISIWIEKHGGSTKACENS